MYREYYSRLSPMHRRPGTLSLLAALTVVALAILGSMWFPNELTTVLQALNGQTLLNNALEFLESISLSIVQFSPFVFTYLSAWAGVGVVLAIALPGWLAVKNLRWQKSWLVPVLILASCLSLMLLPIPTFLALWAAILLRQQHPANMDDNQTDERHWR